MQNHVHGLFFNDRWTHFKGLNRPASLLLSPFLPEKSHFEFCTLLYVGCQELDSYKLQQKSAMFSTSVLWSRSNNRSRAELPTFRAGWYTQGLKVWTARIRLWCNYSVNQGGELAVAVSPVLVNPDCRCEFVDFIRSSNIIHTYQKFMRSS